MNVSVVIPVINGERFVARAIESVFRQRDDDPGLRLQIIVVDNGSTDGTVDCVHRDFGDSVTLVHEPRPGAGCARNAGVAMADSPWIAFLDADDLWLPGKLREQGRYLAARPEMAMVFCHGVEFSDPPGVFPFDGSTKEYLHAAGMLARRAALDAAGPFPETRCGEFIAWFGWTQTLGLKSNVLPGLFVKRRIHAHNSTRDGRGRAEYAQAMKWLLDRRRGHAAEGVPRP